VDEKCATPRRDLNETERPEVECRFYVESDDLGCPHLLADRAQSRRAVHPLDLVLWRSGRPVRGASWKLERQRAGGFDGRKALPIGATCEVLSVHRNRGEEPKSAQPIQKPLREQSIFGLLRKTRLELAEHPTRHVSGSSCGNAFPVRISE